MSQSIHKLPGMKPLALMILACVSHYALAADMKVETSVYGFVNGEIESVKAEGGATPYRSRGRVTDANSRIGFTGGMAINPDLKGIWQIEASLNNFDQGGDNDKTRDFSLTSRNTFVGLQSERFGRFVIGNNDSVYRSLVGSGGGLGGNLGLTTYGLDVWNNTSAQLSGNPDSIFGRGEARYKNSVHYLSPEWNGFQAGASYGFDETQKYNTDRSRYALAGKYHAGPFAVGVAYDHQDNTGVDTDALSQGFGFRTTGISGVTTSFATVVATYRLPTRTTVGIGFESGHYGYAQVSLPSSSNFYTTLQKGTMKQSSAMISLAQEVTANTAVLLSYGKLGGLSDTTFGNSSDYSARQFSLGATYKINENFMPYVYFTKINNHAQQNVNLGQSPLYSNNSGTADAFLAPGDSPRAFGVGLIGRF